MTNRSISYDNKTLCYRNLDIYLKDIRFCTNFNINKESDYDITGFGTGVALVKNLCALEDDYTNNTALLSIRTSDISEHFQEFHTKLKESTRLKITKSFIGLLYDRSLDSSSETNFQIEIYLPKALIIKLKSTIENTEPDIVIINCRFIDLLENDISIVRDSVYIKPKEERVFFNCIGFVEDISIYNSTKYLNYLRTTYDLINDDDDNILGYNVERVQNDKKESEKYLKNINPHKEVDKILNYLNTLSNDSAQEKNKNIILVVRRLDILIIFLVLIFVHLLFFK